MWRAAPFPTANSLPQQQPSVASSAPFCSATPGCSGTGTCSWRRSGRPSARRPGAAGQPIRVTRVRRPTGAIYPWGVCSTRPRASWRGARQRRRSRSPPSSVQPHHDQSCGCLMPPIATMIGVSKRSPPADQRGQESSEPAPRRTPARSLCGRDVRPTGRPC